MNFDKDQGAPQHLEIQAHISFFHILVLQQSQKHYNYNILKMKYWHQI